MTGTDEENGAGQTDIFSFGENTLSGLKEKTVTTTTREYQFTEPLRKCSKCGKFKPLSEFYRDKWREKGRIKKYARICKECSHHKFKKWREDNLEYAKEYERNYRRENHEKVLESERIYREKNPERILESTKKWQRKNPEKVREYNFLYAGGKNNDSGYLSGSGICMLCGKIQPRVLILHHLFPNCNFVVSLCNNCHRMYHTGDQERHMRAIQNAIEKTLFLWKDMKVSKNVEMFKAEDATIIDTISGFDGKQIEVVKNK